MNAGRDAFAGIVRLSASSQVRSTTSGPVRSEARAPFCSAVKQPATTTACLARP